MKTTGKEVARDIEGFGSWEGNRAKVKSIKRIK